MYPVRVFQSGVFYQLSSNVCDVYLFLVSVSIVSGGNMYKIVVIGGCIMQRGEGQFPLLPLASPLEPATVLFV